MNNLEEVVLRGSPISKGIGIGVPVYFSNIETQSKLDFIALHEVEEEIARYRKALDLSRKDLMHLQKMSSLKGSNEIAAILATHLEMMQDPLIEVEIEEKIRSTKQNTESIFHHLIEEYKVRFSAIDDSYFQERIKDIIDISQRILGHLRPLVKRSVVDLPANCVILAQELVPSETIEADRTHVSAFVTETGGLTSHAAIVARAKGIPYIANVDVGLIKSLAPSSLIIDGGQGIIIVNPRVQTLLKYQKLKKEQMLEHNNLKKSLHLKAETVDGYEVRIFANLENPKDIDQIIRNGASGVGLFRSEYLCLSKKGFPSEDEQFETYKKLMKALKGKPLVVRIYDLGGDKKIDSSADSGDLALFPSIGQELNPALGCRAIRFLLKHPEVMHSQLRAILRASRFGEIHILIPMVSDLSELRIVKKKIQQLQAVLRLEGHKIAKYVPVGCMIEVPSSALMCDAIAEESDFISIGTNDLVQYTLAADRANPHTSDLYYSAHPGVLRLIKQVVTHAKAVKKPVILCGEMAIDPCMIPVLIGLGISEFSVSARHIPLVKSIVRRCKLLVSCKIAEKAVKFGSSYELKDFLMEETSAI